MNVSNTLEAMRDTNLKMLSFTIPRAVTFYNYFKVLLFEFRTFALFKTLFFVAFPKIESFKTFVKVSKNIPLSELLQSYPAA